MRVLVCISMRIYIYHIHITDVSALSRFPTSIFFFEMILLVFPALIKNLNSFPLKRCIRVCGCVCVIEREREKERERERERVYVRARDCVSVCVCAFQLVGSDGVATISRLPENVGLFCKRAL